MYGKGERSGSGAARQLGGTRLSLIHNDKPESLVETAYTILKLYTLLYSWIQRVL